MTKRSRTILFFACIILFLTAAPIMTLYSQGYRFDFGERKLVLTGSLSLKTVPRQADVYIDEKLEGKTDFFSGSFLANNLIPKAYKVEVKKDGYFPWEKSLRMDEGMVAEAENIYLVRQNTVFADSPATDTEIYFPTQKEGTSTENLVFSGYVFKKEGKILSLFNPQTRTFENIFEGMIDLRLSPDGKKLIYFSNSEIWLFYLDDIFEQPQRKSGEKVLLNRFSEKIGGVFWLNQDYLVFTTGNKIKVSETDNRDRVNCYDLGEFENPRIFFNPADDKIYLLRNNIIYFANNPLK